MAMTDSDSPDVPPIPEDEILARHEAARRDAAEIEVNIFDGVRGQDGNPVLPVRLKAEDRFCFSCHKGVPCWNACCHGADVTLTPFDILRLARRFDLPATELLERYTVPAMWEKAGLPVAKLRMAGKAGDGACIFLDDEAGCTVYEDRPATCRYYPLGLAAIKMKDAEAKEDFHFLVKEPHCKGHAEDNLQSVSEFRRDQGIEPYDEKNRGWIDILMKMVSWMSIGGPQGKAASEQTKQMFFLVSTDVAGFRRFVFETKFLETYEIDPDIVEELKADDDMLLALGFDWMKSIMFNEPTLTMRPDVLQAAIARSRDDLGAG
jgi:Fe-S-cluster containining protein